MFACAVVKHAVVTEGVDLLVLSNLHQLLVTNVKKNVQTIHKGVDELVLVGHQAFLFVDIQYFRGSNSSCFRVYLLNKVGVLGEVFNRLDGNFAREGDGHDLFDVLDGAAGVADNFVEVREAVFDSLDPRNVDRFFNNFAVEGEGVFACMEESVNCGELVVLSDGIVVFVEALLPRAKLAFAQSKPSIQKISLVKQNRFY